MLKLMTGERTWMCYQEGVMQRGILLPDPGPEDVPTLYEMSTGGSGVVVFGTKYMVRIETDGDKLHISTPLGARVGPKAKSFPQSECLHFLQALVKHISNP